MSQSAEAYARAGVNLDDAAAAKQAMRAAIRTTHGPEVLGAMGGFGGLFALDTSGLREPVLVSSIDGVGTKLKIAFALNRHESVGSDLVNHCINDILVCGARPLFFLDYLALGAMDADQATTVVGGVAAACREAGCALLGGETAAMPGFYAAGEYDLAGCIVGLAERDHLVGGENIQAGDVVIGLPSLGLHTNGYSLARAVFADADLSAPVPELGRALGDELLQPHRSYLHEVLPLVNEQIVTGMAHITGGGLTDNLPRVVPEGFTVRLDASAWDILPIFRLIQRQGNIAWNEMRRVFNLGLGFLIFCRPEHEARVLAQTATAGGRRVGAVTPTPDTGVRVVIKGLV
jgi:phosphoribosylformylglycinamidine cyclo-ligase